MRNASRYFGLAYFRFGDWVIGLETLMGNLFYNHIRFVLVFTGGLFNVEYPDGLASVSS